MRLLQRMGWRYGKGVGGGVPGSSDAGAADPALAATGRPSRWGRVATAGVANTAVFELAAKRDVHGLGFDAFRGAEEFRMAKRAREEAASRPAVTGALGAPGRVLFSQESFGLFLEGIKWCHDVCGAVAMWGRPALSSSYG